MTRDTLLALAGYNVYANRLVMDTAAKLSEEELTRKCSPSQGTVRALLLHMLGGEAYFLAASQQRPFDPPKLSTLAEIRAYTMQVGQELKAFVAASSEDELERVLAVDIAGESFRLPIWQLLSQAVMHSTHHRGELSIVLTQLGYPLPTLDILIHFIEQSGQVWPHK